MFFVSQLLERFKSALPEKPWSGGFCVRGRLSTTTSAAVTANRVSSGVQQGFSNNPRRSI